MTSLLPPNVTPQERSLENAVRQPPLPVPLPSRYLKNPALCPLTFLPWLAWELGVDDWSDLWPEDVKRARIASAMYIHRHKGTRAAVNAAVAALGSAAHITEWFETEPAGDPYTFTIAADVDQLGPDQTSGPYLASIVNSVTRAKNLRSHFEFYLRLPSQGSVGVFAVSRLAILARLTMDAPAA